MLDLLKKRLRKRKHFSKKRSGLVSKTEIKVKILTPTKSILDTNAHSINAPGLLGYMGILPGHACIVAELGKGKLATDQIIGGISIFEITGGYLEVVNDTVIVIVDQAAAVK